MDIPEQFRSKLGVYDIEEMDGVGVKIKATLASPTFPLEIAISEFKAYIEPKLPVVGVDFQPVKFSSWKHNLLLLHAKDRCLVIQLSQFSTFPPYLGRFLSDESICFVGLKIDEHFDRIRSEASAAHLARPGYDSGLTGKGAEIRKLAATVLKNPPLTKCADVYALASKTGLVDMEWIDEHTMPSDWGAVCFSDEEMKYAVHDVYYCYKIGRMLLGML